MMLEEGLDGDPQGAALRAARRVMDAAAKARVEPFIRLTAAFTDGVSLYAIRYATDVYAPTLYAAQPKSGSGFRLVSEPLDGEGCNWQAVPAGSFVTVTMSGMTVAAFEPEQQQFALAG